MADISVEIVEEFLEELLEECFEALFEDLNGKLLKRKNSEKFPDELLNSKRIHGK